MQYNPIQLINSRTRTLDPRWAFSRAGTKWRFNSSGILVSVPVNEPSFTHSLSGEAYGLEREDATTNYARYNRDLTQVLRWAVSNITAVKNATGIDGVANSASSITATAADATILQTCVGSTASATRITGAYVRRKTGTGNVYITQDNGATWTDITSSINSSSYVLVSCPAATVANPVFGFKISTSGDALYVDYVQHNVRAYLTSPIECPADADVTRSADVCGIFGTNFSNFYNPIEGSFVVEMRWPYVGDTLITSGFTVSDGTAENRIGLVREGVGDTPRLQVVTGGVSQAAIHSSVVSANTSFRAAFAYRENDFAISVNGVQTVNSTDASGTLPLVDRITLGSAAGVVVAAQHLQMTYYPKRLDNATLNALSKVV